MGKVVTGLNKPNETKNFLPADDNWYLDDLPMKASTAMEGGSSIGIEISSNTTTGNHTVMGVENSAGADFQGILMEPIVSTDADYATAGKLKKVAIPKTPYAKAYFTVGAGTFTAIDVGKTVEIHSDSVSLAVDTAWKGARIKKYISSTRGLCDFSLPTTETA